MDPITTVIVAAATAGIADGVKDAGKKMVKDGLEALTKMICQKAGKKAEDIGRTIDAIQKAPDDKDQQQKLSALLEEQGITSDAAVVEQAQSLPIPAQHVSGRTQVLVSGNGKVGMVTEKAENITINL